MPVCELRHATTEDTDSVYALICELLKMSLIIRLSGMDSPLIYWTPTFIIV